jgi:hypothetical protein
MNGTKRTLMRTSRHQQPVGLGTMKRPEGERPVRRRLWAAGGSRRRVSDPIDAARKSQHQHPILRRIMPPVAIAFGFVVFFAMLTLL